MRRLLVLGGTHFLGFAVAADAVTRGWDVTVVHRGRNAPPRGARSIIADRTGPDAMTTAALGQRSWDMVVDTWSGEPAPVAAAARALDDRAGGYAFVSSRSVYAWPAPDGADEHAPLVTGPDAGQAHDYGQAKRAAEEAILDVFGERALIARAGLLLGPRERPGRLPWWLSRIARGGDVPVPGPPDLGLQYADARDLAAWILDAGAAYLGGIYNAVGRAGSTTMGDLFGSCVDVTGGSARLRWIPPHVIADAGVQPWTELPLWLPPGPDHAAVHRADVDAVHRSGFRSRPLRETVADTWAWMCAPEGGSPAPDESLGLDRNAEAALLESLPDTGTDPRTTSKPTFSG